jgi:hypothetical protein
VSLQPDETLTYACGLVPPFEGSCVRWSLIDALLRV